MEDCAQLNKLYFLHLTKLTFPENILISVDWLFFLLYLLLTVFSFIDLFQCCNVAVAMCLVLVCTARLTYVCVCVLLSRVITAVVCRVRAVDKLPMLSNLMYALGNVDYADTQRQAAITLEVSSLVGLS